MSLSNALRLLEHYEDLSKNAKTASQKAHAKRNLDNMKAHLEKSNKFKKAVKDGQKPKG